MRSLLVILFISALTLVQARTLSGSKEDYQENDYQESREFHLSKHHLHSSVWPCDVADYREQEKQLPRIDSAETSNHITDHLVAQLRQCISAGKISANPVTVRVTLSRVWVEKTRPSRVELILKRLKE